MSRVCSIHEEFCPEDVCRWCDPPPAEPERLGLMQAIPDSIWFAGNQNQQNAQQSVTGGLYGITQVVVPPPNQPIPGKHLWTSNGFACALCGFSAKQIYGLAAVPPCPGAP